MIKRRHMLLAATVVMMTVTAVAVAGPGLWVTKGPVQPPISWTGPAIDPHAVGGQWFADASSGLETCRPLEFHDNLMDHGGGWLGSAAIVGIVQNLTYNLNGEITGFDILASITNDMIASTEPFQGDNLHGETRDPNWPVYVGDMYDVKLTTEFADNGIQGDLPQGNPYLEEKNIYARQYDELGWYCWTPENPDATLRPWGNYWVPTYDFGNIPVGATVSRTLPFGLYAPAVPGSNQYQFLVDAETNAWDMFMNRTTSLMISQYVDNLLHDDGTPFPAPPRSSDVSVFFTPEPASCVLVLLGMIVLRRR